MGFIHLNVKSGFSFFKSNLKVADIVAYAKQNACSSIALTDVGNMFGTLEFHSLCQKNNIQPLIGVEVKYLDEDGNAYPLILLAKDNAGYFTLCNLSKKIAKFNQEVILTKSDLTSYVSGIIAILPSYRSSLSHKNDAEKLHYLQVFQRTYSDFYLGLELLQDSSILAFVQSQNAIQACIINEVCYENANDAKQCDILSCIKDTITLVDLKEKNNGKNYFIQEEDLKEYAIDAYLKNNLDIAASIHYDFSKIKGTLVQFPLPKGVDKNQYLRALARKGLEKRLDNKVTQIYYERLDYELDIITKTNYSDYFLVVYDYVRFAKTNDILVGPGRGSAASSLVSYVLGITSVDPLKYNLLFERFLNPERISMPDIDIDFIDTKRDLVIDYIFQKYGSDRTAHVIAFQTFGARQAMRDSAKALGLSLREVDTVAKRMPNSYNQTLQEMYTRFSDFRNFIESRQIYRDIYLTALKIEGLPRQTTLHAAGIVVNNLPLHTLIPVYETEENIFATQFDMNYLEQVGLLKMDILGLKNLAVIDDCLKRIKQIEGEAIDINQIDMNHPLIYRLLRSGFTTGVFQVESEGMKRAIRLLKPNNFEDVVALLALFRPGPMEFIAPYAHRKEGKERVDFLDERIKDILLPTYGIIIYQEQIMQILQRMANFSYGTADIVRRAISKKDEAKLVEVKAQFLNGCKQNNIMEETAQNVFDMILKFANYGFNRAHSVSYAFITCQMAYLKAKYPLIFFTSLLSNFGSGVANDSKMGEYIDEIRSSSLKLLAPSINYSDREFVIEKGAIRYSLNNIKGITNQALALILQERGKGLYVDFIDFIVRLVPQGLNKNIIVTLIQAGVFDEFMINRATLLASLDLLIQYAAIVSTYKNDQLILNYAFGEKPNYIVAPANPSEEIAQEYEVLGLFFSAFPLQLVRKDLTDKGYIVVKEIINMRREVSCRIVVLITHVRIIKTKNGKYMAQVKAYDESGSLNITVFPNVYDVSQEFLKKNHYIAVEGYVQQERSIALVAETITVYDMEGAQK